MNQNNTNTVVPPKKSRAVWFFLLPCIAFIVFIFFAKKERPINWAPDLDTAILLARQQKKPVLIIFDAVWSDHCVDMKQNTYTNKKVVAFVEKNFVPVMLDVDSNEALVKKYNVSIPTQIVLLPESGQFAPVIGRHPPDHFIDRLTKALQKLNITPQQP